MSRCTYVVALSLGLLLSACSRKAETSKLVIQLPNISSSSKVFQAASVGSSSEGTWSGEEITAGSDANCYAIMVGGPEADLNINSCKDKASGARDGLFIHKRALRYVK